MWFARLRKSASLCASAVARLDRAGPGRRPGRRRPGRAGPDGDCGRDQGRRPADTPDLHPVRAGRGPLLRHGTPGPAGHRAAAGQFPASGRIGPAPRGSRDLLALRALRGGAVPRRHRAGAAGARVAIGRDDAAGGRRRALDRRACKERSRGLPALGQAGGAGRFRARDDRQRRAGRRQAPARRHRRRARRHRSGRRRLDRRAREGHRVQLRPAAARAARGDRPLPGRDDPRPGRVRGARRARAGDAGGKGRSLHLDPRRIRSRPRRMSGAARSIPARSARPTPNPRTSPSARTRPTPSPASTRAIPQTTSPTSFRS